MTHGSVVSAYSVPVLRSSAGSRSPDRSVGVYSTEDVDQEAPVAVAIVDSGGRAEVYLTIGEAERLRTAIDTAIGRVNYAERMAYGEVDK